jgi:ribosome maturation factor RimP
MPAVPPAGSRPSIRNGLFFSINLLPSLKMTTALHSVADRLQGLVDELLAGTPLFVVELAVRGRRGAQVVDLFLDSEVPLGVDELARLSRELGFLIDTAGLMPDGYDLNVSSPGADRPLVQPRQYRKHVGRPLQVQYRLPEGTIATVRGRLEAANEEGFVLDLPGQGTRSFLYPDVVEVKVQLPW